MQFFSLVNKLLSREREKIVDLKKLTHLGARKLRVLLRLNVSSSTIHRFLKRKNLTIKQKSFRRPLFQNGKAMRPRNTTGLGYLQIDTKHVTPELSGLPFTVYEYAAIDIVSRYKVAVLLPEIDSESASLALEFFLKWFPFKVLYVQTDNGLEYQRSFRTDQDEFYYWLEKEPEHIGELNEWLQKFINQYNTVRPHQALNYITPFEAVKMYQMS